MTTIVYSHDERAIATDSRVIRNQGTSEAEISTFAEKVYTSKCGRLYLTKAGPGWTDEFFEKVAVALIPKLFKLKDKPNTLLNLGRLMANTSQDVFSYSDTVLAVTADGAYVLEERKTRILAAGDIVAMGSGEYYSRAAVVAGQSVVDAVKVTLRFDRLSGGGVHHYKASDLKPMVQEEMVDE
jgi:hypothetical protein